MSWWGKLLGGAFGFAMGGPLGAILGAALGHHFDRDDGGPAIGQDQQQRIQTAFFTTTFAVMGHLAKADGQVSREEISFAENVMTQMSLNAEQRRVAIGLFKQGKSENFDLDGVLHQFRRECHNRHNLSRIFLEIQMQAAMADGHLDVAEERLLRHIFNRLSFAEGEFARLLAMLRGAQHFSSGGYQSAAPQNAALDMRNAYQLLGIDKTASDAEVKRAYRRQMNQHHPDKLVSRGLPEEMLKVATEKSQKIRAAYDLIKASRSMR